MRLDFVVTKINGGAMLTKSDVAALDYRDLLELSSHIVWFRESGIAQLPEQTDANLKLVEDTIAEQTGGAGNWGWDTTAAMLDLVAPEFVAQLQGQAVIDQLEDIAHHELPSARGTKTDKVDPTRPREHQVAALPTELPVNDTEAKLERRARSLSGHESALVSHYFPPWFRSEALSIAPSNAKVSWVRSGESRMHLTRKHFNERNWRNPVANHHRWIRTLLHEAFHVFHHSLPNTPNIHDYPKDVEQQKYQFAMRIGKSSMVDHFLNLNHESQAEMFSEGAAAAEVTARPPSEALPSTDAAKLATIADQLEPVVEFVRRLPPETTYQDLVHPDQNLAPDFRTPDPIAGPDPDACALFNNCRGMGKRSGKLRRRR